MKPLRTFVGIITAVTLLFPAVAPAATTTDNNALLISVLQHLIAVLDAELQQLLALHQAPTTPTLPQTSTATLTNLSGVAVNSATVTVTGSRSQTVTLIPAPISGPAPLAVTFSVALSGGAGTYSINFGDGATGQVQFQSSCSGQVICIGTASHTYTSAGAYTPAFINSSGSTLDTATVTDNQTPSSMGTLSAYPTFGQAPLEASFWYPLADGSADSYSINFGDGTSGTLTIGCGVNPLSGTNACPRALVASHSYRAPGTYAVTLTEGNFQCNASSPCPPNTLLGTVTITAS